MVSITLDFEPSPEEGRYLRQVCLERGECPECGIKLDHSEGCQLCRACGWSACMS